MIHTFQDLRGSFIPNSLVEPMLLATQTNSQYIPTTLHISLKYVSWSINWTDSVTALDCEQQNSLQFYNRKYSRPVNHFECSWAFERHQADFAFGGQRLGERACGWSKQNIGSLLKSLTATLIEFQFHLNVPCVISAPQVAPNGIAKVITIFNRVSKTPLPVVRCRICSWSLVLEKTAELSS